MHEDNAMNTLTDRQQATLARGLSAFDESTRRRRMRRRALQGTLAVVALGGAGLMFSRWNDASSTLPAYVEIITDDRQLTAELELADACERVHRNEGRVVVVECMIPEARELAPATGDAGPVG